MVDTDMCGLQDLWLDQKHASSAKSRVEELETRSAARRATSEFGKKAGQSVFRKFLRSFPAINTRTTRFQLYKCSLAGFAPNLARTRHERQEIYLKTF